MLFVLEEECQVSIILGWWGHGGHLPGATRREEEGGEGRGVSTNWQVVQSYVDLCEHEVLDSTELGGQFLIILLCLFAVREGRTTQHHHHIPADRQLYSATDKLYS